MPVASVPSRVGVCDGLRAPFVVRAAPEEALAGAPAGRGRRRGGRRDGGGRPGRDDLGVQGRRRPRHPGLRRGGHRRRRRRRRRRGGGRGGQRQRRGGAPGGQRGARGRLEGAQRRHGANRHGARALPARRRGGAWDCALPRRRDPAAQQARHGARPGHGARLRHGGRGAARAGRPADGPPRAGLRDERQVLARPARGRRPRLAQDLGAQAGRGARLVPRRAPRRRHHPREWLPGLDARAARGRARDVGQGARGAEAAEEARQGLDEAAQGGRGAGVTRVVG